MGDRLATIDMGRKVGVLCCILGEAYHVLPCQHNVAGLSTRSYTNRRPLIGCDEFYLPSKETLLFVKRDTNINGGSFYKI